MRHIWFHYQWFYDNVLNNQAISKFEEKKHHDKILFVLGFYTVATEFQSYNSSQLT